MNLRELVAATPRYRLAHLPTPIEPMERLSAYLGGPRLWVKRDDLTGLGLGGNKVRKLEFVLPDAIAQDADVLVTAGVAQSNSVRQISAGAAKAGIECHVVEFTDRPGASETGGNPTGNAMLIRLFGATVVNVGWTGDRNAAIADAAAGLAAQGRRPYVVPYGVSNPLGAIGYVAAAHEIEDQAAARGLDFAAVVHASGSGGTQAGLAVALAGSALRVIGVDADAEPERVHADVAGIAVGLAEEWGVDTDAVADSIEVAGGFAGDTYASATEGALAAIDLAARLEGLVLDVVYSGKGLAGLVGMVRAGRFNAADDVLFIHTGGAPGLLAGPLPR
jgi:L-cysteate sulfo-lyase